METPLETKHRNEIFSSKLKALVKTLGTQFGPPIGVPIWVAKKICGPDENILWHHCAA